MSGEKFEATVRLIIVTRIRRWSVFSYLYLFLVTVLAVVASETVLAGEALCHVSDQEGKRKLKFVVGKRLKITPSLHEGIVRMREYGSLVFDDGTPLGRKTIITSGKDLIVQRDVCDHSVIIGRTVYVYPVGKNGGTTTVLFVSVDGGKNFQERTLPSIEHPPVFANAVGYVADFPWRNHSISFQSQSVVSVVQQFFARTDNSKDSVTARRTMESSDAGKNWILKDYKILRPEQLAEYGSVILEKVQVGVDLSRVPLSRSGKIQSSLKLIAPSQMQGHSRRPWIWQRTSHIIWRADTRTTDLDKVSRQLPPLGDGSKDVVDPKTLDVPNVRYTRNTNPRQEDPITLPPVLTNKDRDLIMTDWATVNVVQMAGSFIVDQVAYLQSDQAALDGAGCYMAESACQKSPLDQIWFEFESCPRQLGFCPSVSPVVMRRIVGDPQNQWILENYAVPNPSRLPPDAQLYVSPVFVYERAQTKLPLYVNKFDKEGSQ